MRETYVESKLIKKVEKRGGVCPKWVSPSFAGVPDRLVFLPGGCFGLVEAKAPGKKLRPLQRSRHRLFRKLGFKVYVLDSVEDIDRILDEIGGDAK